MHDSWSSFAFLCPLYITLWECKYTIRDRARRRGENESERKKERQRKRGRLKIITYSTKNGTTRAVVVRRGTNYIGD